MTTRQKEEKTKFAQINTLFETIFSTAYLAIAWLDKDLHFIRVNPAYSEAFQQPASYFPGKHYFDLFPDEDARLHFEQVLSTGESLIEYARPFHHTKGTQQLTTWWDWTVSTLRDSQVNVEGLLLCLVNVTKRIELERELMHITDREQRRLGRELHDGMAQLLTAISIKAKTLENLIGDQIPNTQSLLSDISNHLREATVQTRNISRLLNPTMIETHGLIPALEALTTETQRRFGVACEFVGPTSSVTFIPIIAGHLYRIAQESTTNAIHHGQAQHIRIELSTDQQKRTLRITSDGIPFDASKSKDSDGLGIKGMQYRTELIGAVFTIKPGHDGGTIVTCELAKPLSITKEVLTEPLS